MEIRTNAIYVRQSIDKRDSISIESQIEFCQYELRGCACQIYADKGYSGKNTDRPEFQRLIHDVEEGRIRSVVVYKLDRISRSILDFANMMELFQKHQVEFISSTEKFDTSTPIGRAVLNICIVFAQLERETIQKRVSDAYYSRCQKGYKMGGRTPYGFELEPFRIDNISTKRLVAKPEQTQQVKLMFEMYARPEVSLGDITRYLFSQGILFGGKELTRTSLSKMLRNPVYVQADRAVYDFFKSNGSIIMNEPEDFTGVNGCYLYQGREAGKRKQADLREQILVLAPHEGVIPSELWLKCRRKLMNNHAFQPARKASNTWLAGKIKCGRCHYALMSITVNEKRYLRCIKRIDHLSCTGCGKLHTNDVEAFVYQALQKKLQEISVQKAGKRTLENDPNYIAMQKRLSEVDTQIEQLINALTGANPVLTSYVNSKIIELDDKRHDILERMSKYDEELLSPDQLTDISVKLAEWGNVSFNEKRVVADLLISAIYATSEEIKIVWKI